MTETALVLPVLLTLAFGVADGGHAFGQREDITNAARQALRAAVNPAGHATADSVCATSTAWGPVTSSSPIPPAGGQLASIADQAARESSSDGTASGSRVSGATLTITFNCTAAGKGVTNVTATDHDPRIACTSTKCPDSIRVQVQQAFQPITPFVSRLMGNVQIVVVLDGRTEY
jgi:Flp pilus assembly protein TadG